MIYEVVAFIAIWWVYQDFLGWIDRILSGDPA